MTFSCLNVEARNGFYDIGVALGVSSYAHQLVYCLLVRPDIAD